MAHATGIGFVDPAGLKVRNFKTDASGCDSVNTRIEQTLKSVIAQKADEHQGAAVDPESRIDDLQRLL